MTLLLWTLLLLPVPIGAAYTRVAAEAFQVAPNRWYCASVDDWVPNCTIPDCCGPSAYDPGRLNDDSATTFWYPPESYPSLSVWIQTPPTAASLFYMVAYISSPSGANVSVGTAPSMGGNCTHVIADAGTMGAISQLLEFPGPVTSGIWCVAITPLEPSQVNLYALGVGVPASTPAGQYWDGDANRPCPAGHHCAGGDATFEACASCAPGTYLAGACTASSNTLCAACAPGSFSNATDAPSCAQCGRCAEGYYPATPCTSLEDTQCDPCPSGSVCSNSTIAPCPLGYFCGNGSHAMDLCPEGEYCPTSATRLACGAGDWCPAGSTAPAPCAADFFCPNTTVQLPCPPNATSAQGSTACTCNHGTYAVDGPLCALCPGGFFCRDGAATPCPMDAFCVRGAAVPVPCPPLSTAPMYSNASEACECGEGYYMRTQT
jgi:hypothetical protein